ncbi:MAG: hypothetical protein R6X23_11620 [Acidimicrobiia bacterium]
MSDDLTRRELEAERDFLLRSLDDLELERADGGIDEDSYASLHDDYTARAAATIRALRDGIDARPPDPTTSWKRRAIAIGLIVSFAASAGVSLALALGARLPGQTASGNSATATTSGDASADRLRQLRDAVAQDPSSIANRLLYAQLLEADGDLAGALEQYDAVIALDPSTAQAVAQAGRILYLTAGRAPAADAARLVDRAIERFDRAVELDPEYSEARFFRAIVRANEFGDFAGAQGDLQRYLVSDPNGTFADQARELLADVTAALESSNTGATGQP